MKSIFSVTTKDGHWWEGTLSVRYNLLTITKIIGALLAVVVGLFCLYWLGIGIWAFLKLLWDGLCWLAGKWLWILGVIALAFIGWLLSKINWNIPKPEKKDKNEKNSWDWLWVLLILLCLFGGLFWLTQDGDRNKPKPNPQPGVVTPERFNETFDWVVTTRAYLDGVQEGNTKAEVALVGLKFVNGEPVTNMSFQGKTYEEAVAIIASDWRNLVAENVHVPLNDNQLIALTLFVMRNGKYGFLQSDFLRNVNDGKFSSSTMALHEADGTKRQLGTEAQQYLWVIKNIWDGNITAEELLDCPMFSYKGLSVSLMYDSTGRHIFNRGLKERLLRGSFKTPRKALEI